MKTINLDAIPYPWTWNPSDWGNRVRISLIALPAVLISIYLGLFQWGFIDHVWDPIFGEQSEKVLTSDLSHRMSSWIQLPDAILGALAYLGDIIFALAGSTRRWQFRPWLVLIFGIDVIPLGIVSALLVFSQAFIVGYWCFLCLVSAVISLVLVVFAVDEVYSSILFLFRLWKKTKNKKLLMRTIMGYPSQEAYDVGLEMEVK